MLKQLISVVLAGGLLVAPRTARAEEPAPAPAAAPAGLVMPILGYQLCFGATPEGTRCDLRLPDLRSPPPQQPRPSSFTLLGKTICLPTAAPSQRCDLRLPSPQSGASAPQETRGS
jgi:hypothetical protein